jgi:phosphoribosylanthranilate isomerase
MTRIKICGNTRAADLALAVDLKVDLVGFILTRSKRQISLDAAAALTAQVPDHIARVGVFIDEPTAAIAEAVEHCHFSAIQIYRPVTDADRRLGVTVVPAVRIGNGQPLPDLHFEAGDHPLLDTWASDTTGGGSGQTWKWDEAKDLARQYPIVVSGGLNPGNVADAVRQLKPWGVDVCSGVEAEPGRKDPQKLRAFVEAVRAADRG